MKPLQEAITLGATVEASCLWRGALDAFAESDESLASLCESLDLGIRAAEILVVQRLQPIRDRFPATIGLLLDSPSAEIDVYRDAIANPRALGFTGALDLLSEETLDCVAPSLHRGWEDRAFSCQRSRKTALEAIGIRLSDDEREQLLKLSAYRNRIFRLPPPVRLNPAEIRDAFGSLQRLVEGLAVAPSCNP